jgi:hypothetical protein
MSKNRYLVSSVVLAQMCALGLAGLANAQAPADGIMVLQNLTIPMGGVWLTNSTGGGHWWQTDAVLGICRVDPAPNQTPPWQLTNCAGTVAAGGQAVLADIGPNYPTAGLPAGAKFVFVPDASTKSQQVVRFVYDPVKDQLFNPLIMTVPNVTSQGKVGGAVAGGRPSSATLAPNGIDLYVGYTKSGDIMKVADATNTTSKTPVVTQLGETSDGIGVHALALHKGDLYLAEMGGLGLSRIQDPAGLKRAPCMPAAPCTALNLSPNVSSFPGGLASDGNYLYIGDSPLTTPGSILRYDSVALTVSTYSATVPAYTSTFDGVVRTAYRNPYGLAFAPNGDLYVADDPTAALVVPVVPTLQGHLWRVPAVAAPPTITSLQLTSGLVSGGSAVGVIGTGFALGTVNTQVLFGAIPATSVNCDTATHCFTTSPPSAGPGVVDVRAYVGGVGSPIVPADQFTYVANAQPGAPVVTGVSPKSGVPGGGTVVTITGTGLLSGFVTFGVTPAAGGSCSSDTLCTAVSPAGTGTVDIQVTGGSGSAVGLTSAAAPGDRFTYTSPSATIYAWGITAPKGGMVWVPGALGGHWWSSDHSAGFCRQDPVAGSATLHALDSANCDNGTIGSSGQAVYDPRANADGSHYIYVPDNAVKSTAIWRLTFNPATERLVGVPEAMIPLADVRTLKPNGMALGPDGNLYVTDLTEMNIRKVTGPNGDPRLQTVSIVAVTGDGRGANGTIGFIGNKLYISENRAASWFDITSNCALGLTGIPCTTTPVPLPSGAFVAAVATDPVNNFVYISDSPGGAFATIWRNNVTTGVTSLFLTGGQLPAAGTPEARVWCSQTCTRPWDPALIPGGISGFSFTFGLNVGPDGSLYITEDPTAGNRGGRGHAWIAPLIN